ALLCSAVGLFLGLAAVMRWRLKVGEEMDLRPSLHWGEPVVVTEPRPEDGPVMVMLEYRIDPENSLEFIKAMEEFARVRRRDGAIRWGVYRDVAHPGRYVEHFMVNSWAEHLRQHSRITMTDRSAEDRVRAFHIGDRPPRVSHFLRAG
ncbi:MAG TPA: MFS transporter, partial [Desulfomonilaceae bacterium]|nr:MFS transporter [Desulfomonilaceae bacterium]